MSIITQQQVEEAERVLAFLQANPHLWNQGAWLSEASALDWWKRNELTENHDSQDRPLVKSEALSCGTAGCFAGWHAMLHGEGVYFVDGSPRMPWVKQGEDWQQLCDWVAERLGIEGTDTGDGIVPMFSEDNTMLDLERWVEAMRQSHTTGTDLNLVAAQLLLV